MSLGLRMEEMIFNLADTHFFFNDLEVGPSIFVALGIPFFFFFFILTGFNEAHCKPSNTVITSAAFFSGHI